MALLNIFRGTDAEVSSRPVSDGALLFATDTKKIYLDKGSSRIEMTFKQDLSDYVTDSELAGLLAGKADTVHKHDAADVATGTFDAERIPTITDDKIASVSAEKITGTIPSENLPSYVDDVVEAENYAALPPTGEAGKIYVDKETNKTYRWGGSAYVEISASLALGETSSTAFRGDYGKVAYDHAQAKGSEFATGLYKISTNAEGHVTSATAVTKGDITALGIPSEDTNTTYTAGSGLTLSGTEFGIADGGIIGRHLDDNCVMERNIAVGSVTSDKIPALAITTPKLVDNAVTAIKMADDAVATRSIQDGAVTANKIAEGVIPESVSYDVATPEANGLMSSEDKATLDNLKTNAVTTDASGFVQKSPIKFRNYDGGIELDITGKTETSFDLDMRSSDGSSIVTITGDELFGEKTSAITMNGDATFTMNDKDVKGITDVVGDSADGTKLVTDKAVKDAIDAIEIPDPLPAGGTDGQVLTKTADGEAWEDIPDYENATTEYDGLMSAADKTKLDGIQAGANNYTHPASAAGAKASGLYKVQTDAQGHVIAAVDVVKEDITTLGIPAQDTTYVDATTEYDGLMSAADKTKLDGIQAGANNYTLPVATASMLGGVKQGAGCTISEDGTLAVKALPDGGTTGQILTKTADGEAWQNVPEPDMTGVVKYGGAGITADGEAISTLAVGDFDAAPFGVVAIHGGSTGTGISGYGGAGNSQLFTIGANNSSASLSLDCGDHGLYANVTDESAALEIDSKQITSITDDASTGSSSALATAKAVKDYADSVGVPSGGTTGQVLTKTASGSEWQDAQTIDTPVPISQGGTGVTSEDALVQLVFNSTSTPKASATQYGVVKFASDEDFKVYMGIA